MCQNTKLNKVLLWECSVYSGETYKVNRQFQCRGTEEANLTQSGRREGEENGVEGTVQSRCESCSSRECSKSCLSPWYPYLTVPVACLPPFLPTYSWPDTFLVCCKGIWSPFITWMEGQTGGIYESTSQQKVSQRDLVQNLPMGQYHQHHQGDFKNAESQAPPWTYWIQKSPFKQESQVTYKD